MISGLLYPFLLLSCLVPLYLPWLVFWMLECWAKMILLCLPFSASPMVDGGLRWFCFVSLRLPLSPMALLSACTADFCISIL